MPDPAVRDLVVRLPNWIGDCVMAQPALNALWERGLRFTAWGQGWAPSLFAAAPFPVRALAGDKRRHPRQLRRCGARRCLLLTHSLSTATIARQAGLSAIGYDRDGRAPLLRHRVRWPLGVHEVRRYWLLAEATRRWLKPQSPALTGVPPNCSLRVPAGATQALGPAWQAVGMDGVEVLVCPVATGTVGGQSKHYPYFRELVDSLSAAGRRVAVLAPPGHLEALTRTHSQVPVIGDLSFPAFMALLAQVPSVVANDSGSMHVAAALGTPVVIPFGVTKPHWTGAWSPQLHAVGQGQGWPDVTAMTAAVTTALSASKRSRL